MEMEILWSIFCFLSGVVITKNFFCKQELEKPQDKNTNVNTDSDQDSVWDIGAYSNAWWERDRND